MEEMKKNRYRILLQLEELDEVSGVYQNKASKNVVSFTDTVVYAEDCMGRMQKDLAKAYLTFLLKNSPPKEPIKYWVKPEVWVRICEESNMRRKDGTLRSQEEYRFPQPISNTWNLDNGKVCVQLEFFIYWFHLEDLEAATPQEPVH